MKNDPRETNRKWFADAAYGMFIHYGLFSQLGRDAWAMYHEQIPLAEYEKLAASFAPRAFDADFITDLACDAGMRYVNLVNCHHEGFCLWDSAVEPFNSYRTCGRDLVRELADQCARKKLGFFAYFTHALNWRHPFSLSRDLFEYARPNYPLPEPRYRLTRPQEVDRFWEWSHACLNELCHLDFPLTGIWLDIILAWYLVPDLVPIHETYRRIRAARPEALIAYKQGATGDEDFAAPEFHFRSLGDALRSQGKPAAADRADRAWQLNRGKHNEICTTLQDNGAWGWVEGAPHKTADQLWRSLAYARANKCNLLANVGLLPDGSVHPADVVTLRAVGQRLRQNGLPDSEQAGNATATTTAGAV
jgi:alpha-L-fucosidase